MARIPHWRVPSLLFASLLIGVSLATAQHLFYSWLDGRATDGFIPQNFAVALGTALAFLVKAAFVLCVTLAYTQMIWLKLLSEEVKISHIDDLQSALNDITAALNIQIWHRSPVALIALIIAWLLPLASIIAPSSLTTRSSPIMKSRVEALPVPQLDLNTTLTAVYAEEHDAPYGATFLGPSDQVMRITNAVAMGGALLTPPSMGVNYSYTQTLFAPSLSCSYGSQEFYREFDRTRQWLYYSTYEEILFAAWSSSLGSPSTNISGPAGSLVDLFNHTRVNDKGQVLVTWAGSNLDMTNPSSIYFAFNGPKLETATARLWNCSLFNASYDLNVSSDSNGRQYFRVTNKTNINTVKPLTYYKWEKEYDRLTLSCQSILAAFASIVNGAIFGYGAVYFTPAGYRTVQTNVLQSSLIVNAEVWNISHTWDHSFPDEPVDLTNPAGRNFGTAVEELFRNITLSMLSSKLFRTNATTSPLTDVTFFSPYIVYHYQPRNLIIAYTTAGVLTAILTLIGEILIFTTGRSYTTKFSSIMRATRGEHIDKFVGNADRTPEEPLPKHIAEMKLRLGRNNGGDSEVLVKTVQEGDNREFCARTTST